MKIAYIYPALTTMGGADRVVTEKANYFAETCGYQVFIITAHQMGAPLSFPLSPKVQHIDLAVDFNQQYQYGFVKRGLVYLKLIKLYKQKLATLLPMLKLDIVLTTISRDVDFLTSIRDGSYKFAEAHVSKKYIRNNHLLQQRGGLYALIGKIWAWRLEKAIKQFTGLVVLTHNDALKWESIVKATIIPNAYPFYPAETSNCTSKKVISVGRLEEQKGYDKLVDVWALVHAKHPDWTLTVYGEGSLQPMLTQKITEKHLTHSFIIEKPVRNIIDKYTESSIYVMSSTFEGFGMVLVEAMTCGVPVVSFNCPDGPSEIINVGEDGFLIAPGDIQAMAEKIIYLIENEYARQTMGSNARKNIQRYSPEVVMQQWVQLFEKHVRK
jgi:glycosyltransferase involved in cell wall biosynthesis